MNIPIKKLKNGFSIPVIGKGTWMTDIKKKKYVYLDEVAHIEEIKAALDAGITYIDTAERYASGYGETLIGSAIKGFEREKLFLATKVSSTNLSYENVILSAKRSIKRLHSSYLDLLLIHQFNPKLSLKDTMRAMDYLIENKLIKNIGVCNFTPEQMEEAQSYTKNKIVANDLRYNFMNRNDEIVKIVEYCQKHDIMVIAWRPYQEDLLTKEAKVLLKEVSDKHSKTPSHIATAWLLSQPNTVVLTKFGKPAQILETLEALSITLNTQDIEKLTKERGNKHDK